MRLQPSTEILIAALANRFRFGHDDGPSLRAVARLLGLDAGTLSRILDASRLLTVRQAMRIATRLELDDAARERLLDGVVAEHVARLAARLEADGMPPVATWTRLGRLAQVELESSRRKADD